MHQPDLFMQLLCGKCGHTMVMKDPEGVAFCDNDKCKERGNIFVFRYSIDALPVTAPHI